MITIDTLGSSSKGNAYRLRSGGHSLLLECGLPWKEIQRKLNFETSNLDGCLVSHSHGDHARALPDLLKRSIPVFASKETFDNLSCSGHHRAHIITTSLLSTDISDEWRVSAFDTVHDAPGALGFQIVTDDRDNLVFITDTAYCKYKFHQINVLMIEANFSDAILNSNVEKGLIDPTRARRVRENHLSIERVIDFLKANDLRRCREIILIHLSSGNSDATLFKRMVQEQTGIMVTVSGE
jgi:phosphoribosyl 1,2-cyclic phosphodiesterase